jgi:DNA-binding NtrC family response regulator
MARSTNPRILIVDDEPRIADTLALIFQHAGYLASAAYSGESAWTCMANHPPSLVITDVVMPGLDGVELAKRIRSSYPDCQILLFSGNADTQTILNSAEQQGYAFEIMAKPMSPPQILAKVASLLEPRYPSCS